MIKNYFKIAWRNLLRNKVHGIINIGGLAVGFAGFLIILLYLNHELSYDTWDDDLARVYKISEQSDQEILEMTPAPLAGFLQENAPFVEAATAISPYGDFEALLSVGDKKIYQRGFIETDSSFFKVFPYQMAHGDAATALDKPNSMVISTAVAEKLFGQEDPIGRTVTVFNSFECEVTAVMKEIDKPSHLEAEVIYHPSYMKSNTFWENYSFNTYVKANQALSTEVLERGVDEIFYNHRLKEDDLSLSDFRKAGHEAGLFVDAVQDLHNFPKHGKSNFPTVTILLLLAALLLFEGAINFSNLSIAASVTRAKEVGVRKVLGSSRKQLLWQFLGEITLQSIIALALAVLLASLFLPYFNRLFDMDLHFLQSGNIISLSAQVALCLLLIITLAGLYPAAFLSRYYTVKVLKGDYSKGTKGMAFRNALIVVQFVVSAFFITGAIVISSQMRYMQSKDKGFSGEQVMRLDAMQDTRDSNFETTRNTLLNVPGVQFVSKTTQVPGDGGVYTDTSTVTFSHLGDKYRMASVKVSADYFKTLDIGLVEGRMFDYGFADQHTQNAIINEAAAQKMNLNDPTEAFITFPYCDSIPIQVVGVVKNFNVLGFENTVLPTVYTIGNEACMFQSGGAILVKIEGNDLTHTIASIEQAWKGIEPEFPIRYSFLDTNFQRLFASYVRIQQIINFFGITSITIAGMGLFALTALLVGQRTKEIGIRKVLGAGTRELGLLLSKDFMRLVIIAVIITIPFGWWAAREWLLTFAYRIELNGWMFLSAALILTIIALVTVGVQTVRAAWRDPVDVLRNE